ncbi:MAG: hypothetical protein AAFN93_21715 [Bacteroidota bacterium]
MFDERLIKIKNLYKVLIEEDIPAFNQRLQNLDMDGRVNLEEKSDD